MQNAGSATIFRLINNEWIEIQKIFSPNSNSYDFFGNDLDIYDDKLVIGSYYADNIYDNSGSVFLYELNYDIFELVLELNAYDSYLNDNFNQYQFIQLCCVVLWMMIMVKFWRCICI